LKCLKGNQESPDDLLTMEEHLAWLFLRQVSAGQTNRFSGLYVEDLNNVIEIFFAKTLSCRGTNEIK